MYPDLDRRSVDRDLDPTYLQRLSANEKGRCYTFVCSAIFYLVCILKVSRLLAELMRFGTYRIKSVVLLTCMYSNMYLVGLLALCLDQAFMADLVCGRVGKVLAKL